MKNRQYAVTEAVGCVVIYSAAVVLHHIFRWFGPSALAILFGAVNESVWEHIKIFSAAFVGYALFELLWIRVNFRQYAVAKCASLYVLMGGIIAMHYGAVLLFGKAIVAADVIGSAALVILVQLLSYCLTVSRLPLSEYFVPAIFLLSLYYLMFFSFTIYPPRTELFRDPLNGGFGYLDKSVEKHWK